MKRKQREIIFKTSPSFVPVFFGIFGIAFFGWMVFLMYNGRSNMLHETETVNLKTAEVLYYIFLGIFVFFGLCSSTLFLKMKIIILTSSKLIIKYPFFFLEKTIFLGDIDKILEKDYIVKPEVKGSVYNIHEGKEAIIYLFSERKIKFNSFEIVGYKDLMRKLYLAKSRYKFLDL